MPKQPEDEGAASDPARDLGELWSFGIEASQAMAQQLAAMYQDLPSLLLWPTGDLDAELRRLRIDLERAVDLAVDVFDRMLTLSRRAADRAADAHATNDGDRLLLLRGSPGGIGVGELWIHNRGDDHEQVPVLWCTDLHSGEGNRIPAECLELTATDTAITPGSTRRVAVRIAIGSDTPSGAYHGLVLARDDHDVSFRVRVDVSHMLIDLPTSPVATDEP